jgi:hypothetical protein
LFENNYIGAGWCFVIHYPYRVAGISTQHQPIFTQCYGTPVNFFLSRIGKSCCDASIS